MDETIRSDFPQSHSWQGAWIWHAHAPARNVWVLFRCDFFLEEATDARLLISADTRYRAWVNGRSLGDGPPQSQPYHQYFDERALGPAARAGRNCIAVVVHHQGVQDNTRGGLLAEILDGTGRCVCATGRDWRTMVGTAWRSDTYVYRPNRIGPFQEHVDLRAMPDRWQQAGAEDGSWEPPEVIASRSGARPPTVMPWCRLIPRGIPHLSERAAYAETLTVVEECLDLAARRDTGDISMSLSQAGRPVDWATATDTEALLGASGVTRLACSDRHRDGITDGRYDPCITLDFGRVLTGYAEVEAEAPSGAVLEIGYAERLIDGRFNNSLECPFGDKVTFAEGDTVFRPLVWRAFRYLRLRVKRCERGLNLHAVRAVEVRYPYEARGGFRGPARLEQIFAICRATIELCSIESLMDTPYREQAQWLGDVAAVTVPSIHACFGDTALPDKFLRQAAMNTHPHGLLANISNVASSGGWGHDIPDYSLWWVICLWRQYQYSGAPSCLHACYPEMQRVMRCHLERIGNDGLLGPMFGWVFIDWAHVDIAGVSAALNALFAGACDAAAAVAGVKGDTWAAATYAAAAAGIRHRFAATFTDPESGLVVDAVQDGVRSNRRSEHSNTAAIAFGCVDGDAADRIIDTLFVRRDVPAVEAQPFFMVVVLEALRRRGRTDLALALIDERWGQRMVDRGRTSCTEEWYENGSWRNGDWDGFQRTHSHAWSGCPAEFLITGLAGIRILEPGCARLAIRPFAADAPYEVVFPTPRGDVLVRWDGTAADVQAPDGVTVIR